MKRSRFTEEQTIGILKEHEAGVSVSDLCRKHGVSDAKHLQNGKPGLAAWMYPRPRGCEALRMRMPS